MADSNKKMAMKNGADRIGDLPDFILHHILSFLDMKQVVETSFLSTRWRNLWVSVPVLNFDHSLWERTREIKSWKGNRSFKDEFINFVDKVLFHRDHTSNVTKFKLSCSSYYDTDRFVAWMALAAIKQFQEMHVDLYSYKSKKPELRELSEAIFSSGVTVFVFNFKNFSRDHNVFQMPKSLSLSPHLKTLVLRSVELPQGNSNGELVLSCPVLENLELLSCECSHLNVLIISTLQLISLVIVNSNKELESCEMKIVTPNLEKLKLSGLSYKSFSLGSLPFLVDAKIENYIYCVPLKPQCLIQLLESISCAATVELRGHFQGHNHDISDVMTASFSNLRCLTLGENYFPPTCIMLKVFKSSPCIETLVLKEYVERRCEELYDFNYDNVKSLEIGKFNGFKHEIPFLKFLLKNAVVLEKLTIRMGYFSGRFVRRIYTLVEASSRRIVLTVSR